MCAREKQEERESGMDYFSTLPEGCILDILSLTSPRDACRSSVISKEFKSVADSDALWDRFLPSDHREILSRAVAEPPVVFSTKKQLYFRLAHSHILIDGGNLVTPISSHFAIYITCIHFGTGLYCICSFILCVCVCNWCVLVWIT